MLLPPSSNLALKEWAIAVRTIAAGKQVVILRKGGIHKDDKDFRIVHPEFLLYPTFEHQRDDLIKPGFVDGLNQTISENDVPDLVTLGIWCKVTDMFQVTDEEDLARISGEHIWSDDYAEKRLHWRPKQPLTVAVVRAYELQQPQALPVLDEYGGCKSWVELGQDVPLGQMVPVLPESEFERKAELIRAGLGGAAATV